MTERRWPLGIGGRLVIDGEAITIASVEGGDVRGFTDGGERVRFALTRVEEGPTEACNEEWRFGSVLLDAGSLSDAQLREAAELLAHLNEASFGYRSGNPERPSPGEPRAEFDPVCTTLRQRLEAKASELGCSAEKLRKRRRSLQRQGLAALVDGRQTRCGAGPGIDSRLRAAILAEAQGLADASDVRKMQFRSRVAGRLARESGELLELPSTRQTFNRIVDEVLRPTGLFRLPAKSRRSAQSAPSEGLGSLIAERPGEYVAIDTTSLDVFAIDPFTFQWVGLDLTATLDVCTRSILAFRLTPFSTQGVDLALLLSDLLSPTPMDGRWPSDVPYPYCGVPENLLAGRSLLVKQLAVDEFAIRVDYEIRPPILERPTPINSTWLLCGEDDLGNEYTSAGGAFGLSPDSEFTEGVHSLQPTPHQRPPTSKSASSARTTPTKRRDTSSKCPCAEPPANRGPSWGPTTCQMGK